MMGSVLKDTKSGTFVWGKVGGRLIDLFALPIDAVTLIANKDALVPTSPLGKLVIIPGIAEKEIYDNLNRIAIDVGGYSMNENAFAFSYDWRRDLVEASKQLGEMIEKIKAKYNDPNLKIDLVCHSTGGIIARYYAKYGTEDVLDQDPIPEPTYAGAANINKIIMVGTPNTGSLESFQRLHEGLWLPTIVRISAEAGFTMPSLYELLPYDGNPVFIDANGQPMDINLYNPENWEKYGWSVFEHHLMKKTLRHYIEKNGKEKGEELFKDHLNIQRRFLAEALKRARKYQEALWKGDLAVEKQHVLYALMGSDCQPTLERALMKKGDPQWQTLFKSPNRKLNKMLFGLGDRSVTKESLLGLRQITGPSGEIIRLRFPSTFEGFVCESHTDLINSPTYMDNILHMLLDAKQ